MEQLLNDIEVRVLGSLIEKEVTTPDYYPLSLNALTNACNQSTNRNPVVHFDEAAVTGAIEGLRRKNLIHVVHRDDARVMKYRQVMGEAMQLPAREMAAMCVLMLRGPQTVGEIRTRSNRLYDFADLEEVDACLNALIAREPSLVVRLPRQTGQKEVRYAHLLAGEVPLVSSPSESDRIARLEETTEELRKEVEDLRQLFDQFRKQFE